MDLKTHHKKVNTLLPIDVGKAVVQGGRPTSVCELSFSPSHGRTINDELKKMQHSCETFVRNAKDMKTHHQIILAAACCCWQGGGVGRGGIIQSVG